MPLSLILMVILRRGCCSVAKLCPTHCDSMDCSIPGFPVLHYLPEFAQTHVHWVGNTIQSSHPLFPPSPPALSLLQHQGLFQWVSYSHLMSRILEFQLQHQSFQRVFRVDFPKDWLLWSPCCPRHSQVLEKSSTTVWKPQFFSALPLQSWSHNCMWQLGKP